MKGIRALIVLVMVCMAAGWAGVGYIEAKATKPPASTNLMKADFDKEACERFTALLRNFGHTELTVVEGYAIAKASDLKVYTYVAFMRCTDGKGNVIVAVVKFIKNDLAGIQLQPTGERRIGM